MKINTQKLARPKLFRDPVHDMISFDARDPAEALILSLIETRSFQRLRRIRQLGMADLVYHGAEHSRFQHSIGVAHIARRIAAQLKLTPDEKMEVLVAALLHDVGHGPFSHAIEHVTHVDHEEFTKEMVGTPGTEIYELLVSTEPSLPERVARYFEKRSEFPIEKQVLRDIVSSQLDADRMDYLQRDALATGVKVGRFDFERIIAMLTSANIDGVRRLAVNVRAREAVEGYLIARAHMYKQVYLHKTSRAAENMLQATLARASKYLQEHPEEAIHYHPTFAKLLLQQKISANEYIEIDDTDVWIAFKKWQEVNDPILSHLSRSLLNRRLYKTYDIDVSDSLNAGRLAERARTIAIDLGLDPDYSVFVDNAQDTPYRPYRPYGVKNPVYICLVDDHGNNIPIEEVSEMVNLLGREAFKITRLIVHPSIRARLDETIRVIGGVRKW